MSDRWLYRLGERTEGPVSLADLFSKFHSGEIALATPVWRMGDADGWVPLSSRTEFQEYRRASDADPTLTPKPRRRAVAESTASVWGGERDSGLFTRVVGSIAGLAVTVVVGFVGLPLLLEGASNPCDAAETLMLKKTLLGENINLGYRDIDAFVTDALTSQPWFFCSRVYWSMKLS